MDDKVKVPFVSWNTLASSYANGSSHVVSDQRLLRRKHRVPLLYRTLRTLMSPGGERPVVCLQELEDSFEGGEEETGCHLFGVFAECNYVVVYCRRGNEGNLEVLNADDDFAEGVDPQQQQRQQQKKQQTKPPRTLRPDGVAIAYPRELYSHVECDCVDMDDLGMQPTGDFLGDNFLREHFLKQNVGVVVLLKTKTTSPATNFYVANVHLYWDPTKEFVKLLQMKYFLERIKQFRFCSPYSTLQTPLILAGDFNALPRSPVFELLSCKKTFDVTTISPFGNQKEQLRYICDVNLNKLCRHMRILGLDVAIETKEEANERSRLIKSRGPRSDPPVLERAREEKRILLTPSLKLISMAKTPAVHMHDNKATLSSLLNLHEIVLNPRKFLTRCVICNGGIKVVKDKALASELLHAKLEEYRDNYNGLRYDRASQNGGRNFPTPDPLFQCDGCGQCYWWNTDEASSAHRAKTQVIDLFKDCVANGVQYLDTSGDKEHVLRTDIIEMFESIDLEDSKKEQEKKKPPQNTTLTSLKATSLECPLKLKSGYDGCEGGVPPFTNFTSSFKGTLDYIYVEADDEEVDIELKDMNIVGMKEAGHGDEGGVLPTFTWPSDHLLLRCNIYIGQVKHPADCICCSGGLPMSLFQMAELRKSKRNVVNNA